MRTHLITLGLALVFIVPAAWARGGGSGGGGVAGRGGPPAGHPIPVRELTAPNLAYDIAVLPLEGGSRLHSTELVESALGQGLSQLGLRVVPRFRVIQAYRAFRGRPVSSLNDQDLRTLRVALRCRSFFLANLGKYSATKKLSIGQVLPALGKLIVGGLLLELKNNSSFKIPVGLVAGVVVAGVALVGVALTAQAAVAGVIYDGRTRKIAWRGIGTAQNTKQVFALFASKEPLLKHTLDQALGSLLHPPEPVFPIDPWASLAAPIRPANTEGFASPNMDRADGFAPPAAQKTETFTPPNAGQDVDKTLNDAFKTGGWGRSTTGAAASKDTF